MAGTLEQFIRFGTDASGLERTFRLLQALAQTLLFFLPARALLFRLLTDWVWIWNAAADEDTAKLETATLAALGDLRARFALGRRFFRVFRFLESFSAAWALLPVAREGGGVLTWLEISARSFNGMYLLLETLHFPEALGIGGVSVWGAERARVLHVEGQRFWFFALVCGVMVGVGRVVELWGQERGQEQGGVQDGEKKEKDLEEVRKKRREVMRRTLRRLVADVLDLAVPGAVVGWVPVSPGVVGVMMLGSTWLTAAEVWERCGREIDAGKST
ncbi:peroxisomal biogenesis factor 11-domain-containing protein [Echria macrotheca]|uniref:Peroxisomal biogenesis factor 11-domain-containing protein n=1 Tax=Echria macrotheca TaxID=438768 RepID=A0AAJ0BKG0_9PEZI|nr:peroxisomal biogenesis factor 11-domain-containing protein [Echria macrotheca]